MTAQSQQFAELFPRIYHRYGSRWSPSEYRPSPESGAILTHLAQTGPLTVSEAGKHFDRSQAATSELINRLEQHGLVERMKDERDARKHLVWLTKDGLDLVDRMQRVLDPERLALAFDQLATGKQSALIEGMQALLRITPSPDGTPAQHSKK